MRGVRQLRLRRATKRYLPHPHPPNAHCRQTAKKIPKQQVQQVVLGKARATLPKQVNTVAQVKLKMCPVARLADKTDGLTNPLRQRYPLHQQKLLMPQQVWVRHQVRWRAGLPHKNVLRVVPLPKRRRVLQTWHKPLKPLPCAPSPPLRRVHALHQLTPRKPPLVACPQRKLPPFADWTRLPNGQSLKPNLRLPA